MNHDHLGLVNQALDQRTATPGFADPRHAIEACARLLVRDCALLLGRTLPEPEVHATAERIAALVLAEWRTQDGE